MSRPEISIGEAMEAVRTGRNSCADCRFIDYSVRSYPKCLAVFGDAYCRTLNPMAQCSMWKPMPAQADDGAPDLSPIAWAGFWIALSIAIAAAIS